MLYIISFFRFFAADCKLKLKTPIGTCYLLYCLFWHNRCLSQCLPVDLQQICCIALRVLQTLKRFWVFLFRQSFELGRGQVNADHNATRSPSFAHKNKTENDCRLLKNSKGSRDGDWKKTLLYCWVDIFVRNIRKIFEPN